MMVHDLIFVLYVDDIFNIKMKFQKKVVKQKRKTGEANVPMFMLCVKFHNICYKATQRIIYLLLLFLNVLLCEESRNVEIS